jgi:16S rRNA (adenine1518-N6/adenine1519-N6)-dimethyltransferase
VRARKRFAQHFLEAAWVRKLVDAVAVEPADRLLEIGPGHGALTLALADRAARTIAVEIDRDLAAALRERLPASVSLVEGDVLELDLAALIDELSRDAEPGARVRVVGNLPYNISSPILFRLMALVRRGAPLHDATIMLQREVADRVAASPGTGDWGPLGIAVQSRADVRRLLALPPGAFRPPPRVHSAVVQLAFRAPRVPAAHEEVLDSLVRAVFAQRRKTMLNALRPFASARGHDTGALLASLGLDPRRRPETLSLEEFASLAAVLAAGG